LIIVEISTGVKPAKMNPLGGWGRSQKMAANNIMGAFHSQDKVTMVNHTSAIQSGHRTLRNLHYRRTQWDGFVAAWRSWVAPGLSSGRFASAAAALTLYESKYWKYLINQPDECYVLEVPLCFRRRSGQSGDE
jgi:hypothetical protein